jgi:hypothetical protein
MKFTRLTLENYIGIYNGMGLNIIDIDLSRCIHRTLIIRGENGSGKSTIFNAMTVMPDNNNCFIPGMHASKYIELCDGQALYCINFIHPVKADGSRDTTKAYLSKVVFGQRVELNPNGNVTSFKDILYDELGLDPNFIALSQLSTEDKGLASKKPAERKRFVNSIMNSLEVYNDIYKTLMKKSSNNKALIQSISTRMGALGNPDSLRANLNSIEHQINVYNDKKDQVTKQLMKVTAHKELLDPDGSIQSRYSTLSSEVDSLTKKLFAIFDKLHINIPDVHYTLEDYKVHREAEVVNRDSVDKKIESLEAEYDRYKEYSIEYKKQIAQRKQSISNLSADDSFEDICDKIAISDALLEEYTAQIEYTGIEPGSVTKSEYITALKTLKDIKEAVTAFRANCSSNDAMMEVIAVARTTDRIPPVDVDIYQEKINRYLNNAPRLNETILRCDEDIEKLKNLDNRPIDCTIDTCPFIADLIRIRDNDVHGRRLQAANELSELEVCYEDAKVQIAKATEFNSNANNLNNLIRMINTNGAILIRLPHGAIYKDKISFIEALIANEDFTYIDEIYKYIDLANIFDSYIAEKAVRDDLQKKYDLYVSKSDVIEQLTSEIDDLNTKVTNYTEKSMEVAFSLNSFKGDLEKLEESIKQYDATIASLTTACELYDKIMVNKQEMNSLMHQMSSINSDDESIRALSKEIIDYTNLITPLLKDRDKTMHAVEVYEDYRRDLEVVQEQYNLIETIRYYSSPTSGIQLVFMELYMGKIIGLANELLSLLFGGKFVIQPFIINENEFRIPCLGDGYLNDDISSMSSAQISMISMILGFALLHNSSTRYNIIKLDEIDGPLDENNRILFIDLLNKIMDIMHTEQCVLISHNSELDVDDSDVIVLRSANLSSDFSRGNVIWKY